MSCNSRVAVGCSISELGSDLGQFNPMGEAKPSSSQTLFEKTAPVHHALLRSTTFNIKPCIYMHGYPELGCIIPTWVLSTQRARRSRAIRKNSPKNKLRFTILCFVPRRSTSLRACICTGSHSYILNIRFCLGLNRASEGSGTEELVRPKVPHFRLENACKI